MYWVWSLNHGSNRDYLFLPRERGFPDIYRRNQPTKSGNISALSLRPLASYPSPLSPLFNGSCLRVTTILAAKFSSISAQPLGGLSGGQANQKPWLQACRGQQGARCLEPKAGTRWDSHVVSPELGGWKWGAKLRALRAQAMVFQAQVCSRARGRDPVPFPCQGTVERAGFRESRRRGAALSQLPTLTSIPQYLFLS